MLTSEQRAQFEAELINGNAAIVAPLTQIEVRDVDQGGRRIFGRAVPYNVEIDLGFYRETMLPGVFARSIKGAARALPLLLFHDSSSLDSIVGRVDRWEDTKSGLDGVWLIDDDEAGRAAAAKVESGSLGFMSVGFQPVGGDHGTLRTWDDDDVLHVARKEARLLEVSLTPTPAYKEAVITKVRSRPVVGRPRLDRARAWLTSARG